MAAADVAYSPGQRVRHAEFGEGVVVSAERNGFVRAFFGVGERQVALQAIQPLLTEAERLIAGVEGSPERSRMAWLSLEARALPLMEGAASLTSANIDLLPHQVVLTHRVATASPRRYLIADEVGLGKTIETALVLRELHGRGELRRALMVVPAGLVNNWHRELNEVFHLDFEVFGSSGDVTDRKSNAFAKHDRLIASIDTLKRRQRVRRLLDAPPWDLVVFDEAHHLAAYQSGRSVRKTENYKLGEALRDHCRDLLLLSATPHQGDHFRFWKLVQLLSPTLFKSAEDMVANRHRLNCFVFRRTKADACRPDGSALFARRAVHTESFVMNEAERIFYGQLRDYLQEGFALAQRQGNQGRALGFVMAIFQKIAASSFAAVRRTLRRRMLTLTIHEAIVKDQELDVEGRDALYAEARSLLHRELDIAEDAVGRGEIDRHLADLKLKTLKKLREEDLALASDSGAGEAAAAAGEEMATMAVSLALPEERQRIARLLETFPECRETKVGSLIRGLGALWQSNPNEKIVIFATYLGTVDLIGREIDSAYPGQGVVVLRGGDHGAKLAAERRFRKPDGPRVLVCTAAGREGINLQCARVLFNFDLPWNPMDLEQRIGRIHRYGQAHTAQVYNLVLSDTIEGRIFLMLDEKLTEIAKTLGKLDEDGQIAEDLRTQILGQLAEHVRYDQLYQAALSDPELKRTKVELDVALSHAKEARSVVWELFQDLEGFNLDDYRPFSDVAEALERLIRFLREDLELRGHRLVRSDDGIYEVRDEHDQLEMRLTTNRDLARARDDLDLLGLDHPVVNDALERHAGRPAEELGAAVVGAGHDAGVATWWSVEAQGIGGERTRRLVTLAVNPDGSRYPLLERQADDLFLRDPAPPVFEVSHRLNLLHEHIEPLLQRELRHRGVVHEDGGFRSQLVGWVEIGSTLRSAKSKTDPPPSPQVPDIEPIDSPPIEQDISEEARYASHLPIYSLDAIAASAPAGEFGSGAVTQHVEPEGWLRVDLGRRLNDRMFICHVRGDSMDNGSSGLVDGSLAVFELWPRGTRQHKVVLVRGAFADPETGSYAVKKYVADQRGPERRHREIRLVSLNPDKGRFPDIVLDPESESDLQILAEFLTALGPESYAETPHRTRSSGRRDLESEAGQAVVADRLEQRARKFFGDCESRQDREAPAVSLTRLVVSPPDEGGLQIEVDPLADLIPPLVKRLSVGTSTCSRTELASNLRHRKWRVPVEPSSEDYLWSAPGQDELVSEELGLLSVPGLSGECATPFKVDARGVGRIVGKDQLTSGREYRVLVPPELVAAGPDFGDWHELPGGWCQWNMVLPSPVVDSTVLVLERLGLGRGHEAPRGDWVAESPVSYREGASGEPYPCFLATTSAVLRVRSRKTLLEGELSLFLWSSGGTTKLALPPGDEWLIELGRLSEGNYLLQALHQSTRVLPENLPFAVASSTPSPVRATVGVDASGCTVRETEPGLVKVDADLVSSSTELEVLLPPFWPVGVSWCAGFSERIESLVASSAGSVSLDEILDRLGPRVQSSRAGDVVLELRELGRVVLAHTRRPSVEEVKANLRKLASERASSAEELRGEFALLETTWLRPLLRVLGYEMERVDRSEDERGVTVAPFLLLEARRLSGGKVIRQPGALLLATGKDVDLARNTDVRQLADDLCTKHELHRALFSDGLLWTKHRRGSRLRGRVWDVRDLVDDDAAMTDLEAFLLDFAVGL